MKAKLSPYQRIMRASEAGRGLWLTAEEVGRMSQDDAITALASNDDAAAEEDHGRG